MLNRARVARDEVIVVSGASGSIGSALVQLARLRGARPLAIVGPGKEDAARKNGAILTVARRSDSLASAVRSPLRGAAIDVYANVVGGH